MARATQYAKGHQDAYAKGGLRDRWHAILRACLDGFTSATRQYGEPVTSLPEESPSLIGEDDREAAVGRLQEAYAEGLIAHEVLDEHLHQVLSAKTQSELGSALASLPEEQPGSTAKIAAAGGRIKRRGAWRVPRVLKVESAYGRVRLDLSRAVIRHVALAGESTCRLKLAR